MEHIDQDIIDRLKEKFGPVIDLNANPEILGEVLNDVLTAPEFQAGPREYYKGDRFSKEMVPGRPPYEKNYTRGWAVVDVPEEMADVIDEIQLDIDRRLLERLRLKRESDGPPNG